MNPAATKRCGAFHLPLWNRPFPGLAVIGRALALGTIGTILLTGCVSAKYKMAPVKSPAPPSLGLKAVSPVGSATLHAVIVFHGPGSWKKDAYWDEYVVSVTNDGVQPLTVNTPILCGDDNEKLFAGAVPWPVERISRQRLKVAKRTGRNIMLGAGATAAWVGSAALIASNITIWGGVTSGSAMAAGAVGFVGIPLVALGSGVRTLMARNAIEKQFERRRFRVPVTLPPGATHSGSLFFPITPAPRQLSLRCLAQDGTVQELVIDLSQLADLHLAPTLAQSPPTTPTPAP